MLYNKKETKTIKGIIHKRCIDCGKWHPKKDGISRCEDDQKEFIKRYKETKRRWDRDNKKGGRKKSGTKIEKELSGKVFNISDLYDDCTLEQVRAMLTGDVQALLKA